MAELTTLPEIINGINNYNVLLPHFQREYVWNKTQQKNLILSVLTKLPSSSSLVLKQHKSDKYRCLQIGMRNELITKFGEGDCYYLLDGQQRFTTLFYAFHNIFNSEETIINETKFEKLDNKLKKRWYLNFENNGKYIFNFDDLNFNKEEVENYLPEELDSFIEFKKLKKSDLKNHTKDFEEIEENCKAEKKIPLFLILDHKTELKRILKKIYDDRIDEIKSKIENKEIFIQILNRKNFKNPEKKVEKYKIDEAVAKEIDDFLEDNGYKDDWADGVFDYFKETLKNYKIQPIKMVDRNKAVKTFEYINTGGTNLSSFDLLCAKIGKFDLRKEVIEETKKCFSFYDVNFNVKKDFILYQYFGLIGGNSKNLSLEKKYAEYLSQVLNLLHFKSRGKTPLDKEFSPSILKSKYSLDELGPDFIENHYEKAVDIIKKSAALLQVFCSHKNLNSITNYLSLIQLFTFFTYHNDSKIEIKHVKNLISMYWLTLFSGHYNSHQNENSILDSKIMYKFIFNKDQAILKKLEQKIAKDLLKDMKYASQELPADEKRNSSFEKNIFMFLRSSKSKFLDLDNDASVINIEDEIEIHHLIPLGSATLVGESTKKLRKNEKHLLNATMNKTPITKNTNNHISDKTIERYHEDLEKYNTQFSYHLISSSWANISFSKDEETKQKITTLFEARYERFLGDLRTYLNAFLSL